MMRTASPTSPGWYFLAVPESTPLLVRIKRERDESLSVFLPSPGPGWIPLSEMQWQAAEGVIPLLWAGPILPSVNFTEQKTLADTIARGLDL